MKYLNLDFTTNVMVQNIFLKSPDAPISFGPKEHTAESVKLNFQLIGIPGPMTNIGVTIKYDQNLKPQLKRAVWITGENKEYPLSDNETNDINKIYLS